MPNKRELMYFCICRSLLLCLVLPVLTAASATGAELQIDYGPYDALLKKYVQPGGVNYKGLKGDVDVLDGFIQSLANFDLKAATDDETLAFYINAYNACTVRMILRHYPKLQSITQIEKKYGYHQWKHKEWRIAGDIVSLDQIEHEIIRPKVKEPRIHFALNCASKGCPDLRAEAYRAKTLDQQLTAATRAFFSTASKGVRLDNNTLYVSKLLKWYGTDFGNTRDEIVAFVAKHAPEAVRRGIDSAGNKLKLAYLDYDWSLNDSAGISPSKAVREGRRSIDDDDDGP